LVKALRAGNYSARAMEKLNDTEAILEGMLQETAHHLLEGSPGFNFALASLD
jgi:hypothetical protein